MLQMHDVSEWGPVGLAEFVGQGEQVGKDPPATY